MACHTTALQTAICHFEFYKLPDVTPTRCDLSVLQTTRYLPYKIQYFQSYSFQKSPQENATFPFYRNSGFSFTRFDLFSFTTNRFYSIRYNFFNFSQFQESPFTDVAFTLHRLPLLYLSYKIRNSFYKLRGIADGRYHSFATGNDHQHKNLKRARDYFKAVQKLCPMFDF